MKYRIAAPRGEFLMRPLYPVMNDSMEGTEPDKTGVRCRDITC